MAHISTTMQRNLVYIIAVLLGTPMLQRAPAQGKIATSGSGKAAVSRKVDDRAALHRVALQGTWHALAATSNGEAAPQAMLSRLTLVFKGDMVAIMGNRPTRFRLNTRAAPTRIDLLNSQRQVGIYALQGKTLKLCFGQNGDRPNSFTTRPYTDYTYLVLARVKK